MVSDEIRQVRTEYIMSHHRCGYCRVLPLGIRRQIGSTPERIELEHIWQRAGGKIDHPANYIMACRPCHEWKHENTVLGRIAALAWKHEYGEFDREALRALIDRDPIGWLSAQRETGLPNWAEMLAMNILEAY